MHSAVWAALLYASYPKVSSYHTCSSVLSARWFLFHALSMMIALLCAKHNDSSPIILALPCFMHDDFSSVCWIWWFISHALCMMIFCSPCMIYILLLISFDDIVLSGLLLSLLLSCVSYSYFSLSLDFSCTSWNTGMHSWHQEVSSYMPCSPFSQTLACCSRYLRWILY